MASHSPLFHQSLEDKNRVLLAILRFFINPSVIKTTNRQPFSVFINPPMIKTKNRQPFSIFHQSLEDKNRVWQAILP